MSAAELLAVDSIPLREVSALALRGGTLFAVGDHSLDLAHASVHDSDVGPWATMDLAAIPGMPPDLAQCEALAATSAGLIVGGEEPALLVHIDPVGERLLSAAVLRVEESKEGPLGKLGKLWRKEENSRVEGLLPLTGDRVLAVKEKKPAALMVFGPLGASSQVRAEDIDPVADPRWPGSLHALRWWLLPAEVRDASAITLAPDGRLAVLSDQARAVFLLDLPLPAGREASVAERVDLPEEAVKPEGLAWLAPDLLLVACDTKRARRNLLTLRWR